MIATNPPMEDLASRQVQEAIHNHWVLFVVQGLIMATLGVAAVTEPMMAAFAVDIFLGWLLLVGGMIGLVGAFLGRRISGLWWLFISASLAIAMGAYLIWQPLGGTVSLTIAAAAFFGAQSISQLVIAMGHRAVLAARVWILFSSVVNFGLAVIIFSDRLGTAEWTLGLAFGINLFMWGVAVIMTALSCRSSYASVASQKASKS